MNIQQSQKNKGFTLIELLIVVTIIGVLATIGLVSYRGISENARNSKRRADISTVTQALALYRINEGVYPNETNFSNMLTELLNNNPPYISQPLPRDPRNDAAAYTYNPTPATNSFCACAALEGENEGNSSNNNCTFSGANLNFFCMTNPP